MKKTKLFKRRTITMSVCFAMIMNFIAINFGTLEILALPLADESIFTYEAVEGGVAVTGFDTTISSSLLPTEFTIPSTINGQPVVAINRKLSPYGGYDRTFDYVTSISAPSVTSIGDSAFSGYQRLTTVDFPNVTSIGDLAFYDNVKLASVDFPNVTSIGGSAFKDCWEMTTADLPNAISIGDYAFENCFFLTSVEFPNVTSIGNYSFSYCASLISVDFPNVTSIGDYAFKSSSLTSINIPKFSNQTNYDAFNGAILFDCVIYYTPNIINNGINTLLNGITSDSKIKEVHLLNVNESNYLNTWLFGAVADLKAAFDGCTVYADSACKSIFDQVIAEGYNITFVSTGDSATDTTDESIFTYEAVTDGVEITGFNPNIDSSLLPTSLVIPSAINGQPVVAIGNNAFKHEFNITSVSAPSVISIGEYAFDTSFSLTSADFPNVTSIGDYAFCHCSSLTSIDFPNVTSIGEYAFVGCASLTSYDFSKVTSIGSCAFQECTSLTSIDFPNATSIEGWAFYNCKDISYINFPKLETAGYSGIFYYTNLKNCVIKYRGKISPDVLSIGMLLYGVKTESTVKEVHFLETDENDASLIFDLNNYLDDSYKSMYDGCVFYADASLETYFNFTKENFYSDYNITFAASNGSSSNPGTSNPGTSNPTYPSYPQSTYSTPTTVVKDDPIKLPLDTGYSLYYPIYQKIDVSDIKKDDDFKITVVGLPDGMNFDGVDVIYGIPTETGKFIIEITAKNGTKVYTKTFDLVIDESELPSIPPAYKITESNVPTIIDISKEVDDYDFTIDAPLSKFIKLWLNGRELIRDEEYTVKEGSTVVTLLSKTLKGLKNGDYTAVSEFEDDEFVYLDFTVVSSPDKDSDGALDAPMIEKITIEK